VIQGRTSDVRGIALAKATRVISGSRSCANLDASAEERVGISSAAERGAARHQRVKPRALPPSPRGAGAPRERHVESASSATWKWSEAEQLVVTDFRARLWQTAARPMNIERLGAGGKGIVAMAVTAKDRRVVASFPVGGRRSDHAVPTAASHPHPLGRASASPAARRKA